MPLSRRAKPTTNKDQYGWNVCNRAAKCSFRGNRDPVLTKEEEHDQYGGGDSREQLLVPSPVQGEYHDTMVVVLFGGRVVAGVLHKAAKAESSGCIVSSPGG